MGQITPIKSCPNILPLMIKRSASQAKEVTMKIQKGTLVACDSYADMRAKTKEKKSLGIVVDVDDEQGKKNFKEDVLLKAINYNHCTPKHQLKITQYLLLNCTIILSPDNVYYLLEKL